MKKEFLSLIRDPVMMRLVLVVPILQLIIVGFALNTETSNINFVTYGNPDEVILNEFKEHAIASERFRLVPTSYNCDPIDLVKRGDVECAVVVNNNDRDNIQVLINAANVVRAQAIESYVVSIFDKIKSNPEHLINETIRVLYNPTLKTTYYLIPALMGLMCTLITILLVAMAFAKEEESGTLESLLSTPITASEMLIGKSVPFVILGIINQILTCIVAVIIFNMPFRGYILELFILAVLFSITAVALGTLISSVTHNQQQAMMGSFLFLFPSIILSGMIFPLENVPDFILPITYINPIAHYNYAIRNIILKGGNWNVVASHVLAITAIGIIAAYFSYRRKKKLFL